MTSLPSESLGTLADALRGQYELVREIGRGGMGIVYLARDIRLDRPVAIKTLPPHLANDAAVRERFLREARTAAGLSHQHIVPVHRADDIAGHVFFVMGFVDGESLAQRVRAGQLTQLDTVRILRDVALALDYAHSKHVVHRDIKAENILIDRESGHALVTDFGIARLAEAAPLTSTGQVLGTVYYLSPEQISGNAIDGRSDLYSLGVTAFLALTGRFPFDAPLASAVLVAHVTKDAPLIRAIAPDVSSRLAQVVDRCLRKDPGARFQTGGELARELTEVERELQTLGGAERRIVVSDAEAQLLWQRAAELQDATRSHPAPPPLAKIDHPIEQPTSGYTVDTVRGAAREAGIATAAIDRALVERGIVRPAAQRTAPSATSGIKDLSPLRSFITGQPGILEYELIVDVEVSERNFDVLGDIIRSRSQADPGVLSAVGRSLMWTSTNPHRRRSVSITARRGKTTIRCSENLSGLTPKFFVPSTMIGLWGGGVAAAAGFIPAHHPILGLFTWLTVAGSSFGVARALYGSRVAEQAADLRTLAQKLALEIRDSSSGRD